jgi:tetratricopeptide (TPR) repeat protein
VAPTGWRKWLYRLTAVTAVPAVLFGLLELGLWTFGYGYPTSFFVHGFGPGQEALFVENRDFGRRFFPAGLARSPLTLTLPMAKAARTYRIFVLGESAAMGFPDPSCSFARVLEVMLREAYPTAQFEVVNTAMAAINSNVILPIARECAQLQPDFFVVFMGNNEVVGPFGAAGVLGASTPSTATIRTFLAIKTTRTGQLVGNLVRRLRAQEATTSWEGMAMFTHSEVSADDPRLEGTRSNFRQNLKDICAAGTRAGAHVLLCTVPVNLRDSAPFASEHRPDLSATSLSTWKQMLQDGMRQEAASDLEKAAATLNLAATMDDRYAELAYRQARCAERLGSADAARRFYQQACDLDALRFRADTSLNASIRALAAATAGDGVSLVDAEHALAAGSAGGVPGEDRFLEHVHLNFAGNYVLARTVFEKLAERLPGPGVTTLTQEQCADRLVYDDFAEFKTAQVIRKMLRDPPFNGQLDRDERGKRWDARVESVQAKLNPEGLQAALARRRLACRAFPKDWAIREKLAELLVQLGHTNEAITEYRALIEQVPHSRKAYHVLGVLLRDAGKLDGARSCFESVLAMEPDAAIAHYDLALVLAAQGKIKEARARFTQGMQVAPNRAEALASFASFLSKLGQPQEARERLDEALTINPDDPTAHEILGDLLAQQGDPAAALQHFEAVIRVRPSMEPELADRIAKLRKQ